MGEQENLAAIGKVWDAVRSAKFDVIDEVMSPDFVQHWPQSGEVIRGAANAKALNENFKDLPEVVEINHRASGKFVVSEGVLKYPEAGTYNVVSIFEFGADGKVAKQTDYFGQPFEAPQWRAKWVEKA